MCANLAMIVTTKSFCDYQMINNYQVHFPLNHSGVNISESHWGIIDEENDY